MNGRLTRSLVVALAPTLAAGTYSLDLASNGNVVVTAAAGGASEQETVKGPRTDK